MLPCLDRWGPGWGTVGCRLPSPSRPFLGRHAPFGPRQGSRGWGLGPVAVLRLDCQWGRMDWLGVIPWLGTRTGTHLAPPGPRQRCRPCGCQRHVPMILLASDCLRPYHGQRGRPGPLPGARRGGHCGLPTLGHGVPCNCHGHRFSDTGADLGAACSPSCGSSSGCRVASATMFWTSSSVSGTGLAVPGGAGGASAAGRHPRGAT